MHISKVRVKNFRLLKDTSLELRNKLSLLIGRNNSGKTSLLVILEKFYEQRNFNYDDFSTALRKQLIGIDQNTDTNALAIQMILEIEYNDKDNLENLSELILDLEPEKCIVKILFECSIDKKSLLKDISTLTGKDKEKFIIKNLSRYLTKEIYVFENEEDLIPANRHKLIKKKIEAIKKIINLQVIHAKRNVASSEEASHGKKALSGLTTDFFNRENKNPNEELVKLSKKMGEIDADLNKDYTIFFDGFLNKAKSFLKLDNLQVISDIESDTLIENASRVIYGSTEGSLPEHLNGLGVMNILYLLLSIEIKKGHFKAENKDINLLLIEEPEAHTHPHMQYIFVSQIENALNEIEKLQALITTHSSHIVSQCNFEDIRYCVIDEKNLNVKIKNFYSDLREKYTDNREFTFLTHYLNIQSAELFFASKVIFIEGMSERILLPYFIDKFDKEKLAADKNYTPLSSENISILEVGANSKAFKPFLELLNIKTLIITDIDTTEAVNNGTKTIYKTAKVDKGTHTSNATLTHFFNAPDFGQATEFKAWFEKLKNCTLSTESKALYVSYQKKENSYHARSFEDAFVNVNKETIKTHKDALRGLKNAEDIETVADIYDLTSSIIDKKSDFASSVLYLTLSGQANWQTPLYIQEGLSWIAEV